MPEPMTAEEFINTKLEPLLDRHVMVEFVVEDVQSLITAHRRDARCKALEEAIAVVAENEMCDDCMHALERFIAQHDAEVVNGN